MNIFRKLWDGWFKKQHGYLPVNGSGVALSDADLEKHFQLLGKPVSCMTSFNHISREMVHAEEERRGRVQSRWDTKPWQQLQGRWAKGKKPGRARRGPQNPQQHTHIHFPLIGRGVFVMDGQGSLDDALFTNSKARRRYWWNIYKRLFGDIATRTWRTPYEAAEVQVRWDENRMQHRTVPALGATRRLGRL